jgi:pimeloyl-ACP methyl ester carboxylesterase
VLAYHHGTLFPADEGYAPSHDHPDNFETWFTAAVLAASGRVVCAPDYLGYGASAHLEHPYEHAESQAIVVVDALRATLELMDALGVGSTGELFLAGYSEGGAAALATHRALEVSLSPPLVPSLTVALAGAYPKTAFADSLLGSSQPQPSLRPAVWTIRTYDRQHGLDRPLVDYFLEPWASALASDPFVPVPQVPTQLFQPTFVAGVLDRSDAEFSAALAANDTHEWAPIAPVLLVHGTDDVVVPFFLSVIAHGRMTALGGNVELEALDGLDHVESERELARIILERVEAPTSVRE